MWPVLMVQRLGEERGVNSTSVKKLAHYSERLLENMKTSGSFLAAGPCRPLHILWRPHKHPAAWEITGKYPGEWWQSHFKILSTYFILYCRPTTADAIMFGYIAPLLRINFPRNRLKGHIESYQNIIQTIDFILRRYFPPSAQGMFCVQLNVLSQFNPSVQCMDEGNDIFGCHPDHLLNYMYALAHLQWLFLLSWRQRQTASIPYFVCDNSYEIGKSWATYSECMHADRLDGFSVFMWRLN